MRGVAASSCYNITQVALSRRKEARLHQATRVNFISLHFENRNSTSSRAHQGAKLWLSNRLVAGVARRGRKAEGVERPACRVGQASIGHTQKVALMSERAVDSASRRRDKLDNQSRSISRHVYDIKPSTAWHYREPCRRQWKWAFICVRLRPSQMIENRLGAYSRIINAAHPPIYRDGDNALPCAKPVARHAVMAPGARA